MIDVHLAREMELYMDNDWNLYRWEHDWYANYMKKIETGKYNHNMAVKGIMNNFVPGVLKSYRKEFGLGQVNKETKKFIAEKWVKEFERMYYNKELSFKNSKEVREWISKNPYRPPVRHF